MELRSAARNRATHRADSSFRATSQTGYKWLFFALGTFFERMQAAAGLVRLNVLAAPGQYNSSGERRRQQETQPTSQQASSIAPTIGVKADYGLLPYFFRLPSVSRRWLRTIGQDLPNWFQPAQHTERGGICMDVV